MSYTNLHVHDQFSTLDAIGTDYDYCKKASELGHKALSITNHGNIDNFISFQKSAKAFNIKPIFGCELYLVEDVEERPKKEKRGHATLWVKNEIGYKNLLKILSFSNVYGFYRRPRCSFDFIIDHLEGLAIGTACTSSFLNIDGGEEFFAKIVERYHDDVFIEIMHHNFDGQIKHNEKCIALSNKYNIPLIATVDCHYVEPSHSQIQEVLLCMQSRDKMSNPDRWKFNVSGLHFCDEDFIKEKFIEQGCVPENIVVDAINNTQIIVDRCDFEIKKQGIDLPVPPKHIGKDENIIIVDMCQKKLKELFDGDIPDTYKKRFDYELEVIKDKGFVRYFLIVEDIIGWCRENNILTGPRGSVAGCLIGYLLGFTEIDPIKYGLIFERFLNKHRMSWPDVDVDIEDSKRHLVIERLKNLYGEKRVSGVTTFLRMEARGIIKDVCRVYDIPLIEVNNFTKIIDGNIEDAVNDTEIGKEFDKKYHDIVEIAKQLQGQIKSYGKHAAGIVLSPYDLDSGINTHLVKRGNDFLVNWDKEDVEFAGLIKFDFLGLSTLSTISKTLELIESNHDKKIELYKDIPFDDEKVYKEISDGNTVGCFQIGTFTLTRLIKEMGVSNILHLSDALALCRPGPFDSGMTASYIQRKHGETWVKRHEIYEEITKDSYGVCCYQEQLMFVFNRVAGLSLEVADEIRKIIGKKKNVEEFLPFKQMFIDGCLEQNTFSERQALEFWAELEHSAKYLFNISHSLSYAFDSYFTAYLKYYYPTEFLCASLTHGSAGMKLDLIKEVQRLNLEIIPPRIGRSDVKNWIAKDGKLYVPFIEIAGIGPKMAETLQDFISFKDDGFFSEKEKPVIKGKLKTILDDIGAFDGKMNDDIDKYFDIGMTFVPKVVYPKLYDLVGINDKNPINKLLSGDFRVKGLTKLASKRRLKGLTECERCSVRKNCKGPVNTTNGLYNVMILNENVNWIDEKNKKHCQGDSFDKMLWPMLEGYGYEPSDFIKSSIVKCSCKRPSMEVIKNCSGWLKEEIKLKEVYLVLSFGNNACKVFRGEESGIQRLNGTCEWNEEYGCYVVYCVNPYSALMHVDAREMMEIAVKNFVQKLTLIGGFE